MAETKTNKIKITTQKLHSVIQAATGELSSKYSPSQRIDRRTYDLYNQMAGVIGVFSNNRLDAICEALKAAKINFDDSTKAKGFIKVPRFQAATA